MGEEEGLGWAASGFCLYPPGEEGGISPRKRRDFVSLPPFFFFFFPPILFYLLAPPFSRFSLLLTHKTFVAPVQNSATVYFERQTAKCIFALYFLHD